MQINHYRIKTSITTAIFFSVIITACNSPKPGSQTTNTDSVVKSTTILNAPQKAADSIVTIANPGASQIMLALYNSYDPKNKSATWICNNPDKLKKFNAGINAKFISKLLFADSLNVKGKKQMYVIISSRPDRDDFNCHACAPVEEVFILEKDAPIWRLIYRKIFDQTGSYGASPEFTLKKLGADSYGFLIAPSDIGQGIEEQSIEIYSYYQAEFKSVLNISEVAMNNKGECDEKVAGSCWSYDYTLKFANTTTNYNDIILTQKGTQNKDGKVIPIDTTITYKFAGNAYSAMK